MENIQNNGKLKLPIDLQIEEVAEYIIQGPPMLQFDQ
jgi:hypothetical protein